MAASNSLPEGYLEAREQIKKRDETKESVIRQLNRAFCDFGVAKVSKRALGEAGRSDWTNIITLVSQWESRGLLKILTPIDQATDDDIVIEMLNFID